MDENVKENESSDEPSAVRMSAPFFLPKFLDCRDPFLKFAKDTHCSLTNQSGQQTALWRYRVSGGLRRRKALVWRLVPDGMVRLAARYWRWWCALRLEGRSFRGHMRTLLAKKHWGVDLGSLGAYQSDGHLIENERTKAHSLGMQELLSRCPWASTTDIEIYLSGFRAGEQFAHRTAGLDLGTEARAGVARDASFERGNSTPHLAVQQSAKHDRQDPLPSPPPSAAACAPTLDP